MHVFVRILVLKSGTCLFLLQLFLLMTFTDQDHNINKSIQKCNYTSTDFFVRWHERWFSRIRRASRGGGAKTPLDMKNGRNTNCQTKVSRNKVPTFSPSKIDVCVQSGAFNVKAPLCKRSSSHLLEKSFEMRKKWMKKVKDKRSRNCPAFWWVSRVLSPSSHPGKKHRTPFEQLCGQWSFFTLFYAQPFFASSSNRHGGICMVVDLMAKVCLIAVWCHLHNIGQRRCTTLHVASAIFSVVRQAQRISVPPSQLAAYWTT